MIICFTSNGFSRFTHSLSRFCGMNRNQALALTNQCARANFDAFRATPPDERTGKPEGLSISMWDEAKPYQTEMQLYKAIQTLVANMVGVNMTDAHREAISYLHALQNDLNEHCWNSYGLDIEDERTVYALCESTLEPQMEPPVCLRKDWNILTTAAADLAKGVVAYE